MPVQVFVDESESDRHFVMCGVVSDSPRWAGFSEEWQRCLRTSPSIRRFKMSEAAGLSGEFYGWDPRERDAKLLQLARIINKYVEFVIYCGINVDAHKKTWRSTLSKPLNERYFWPFHITIMGVTFDLADLGWRERFEIVFDEHVIFGPRAKAWYRLVQEAVRFREPSSYPLMPVEPVFRDDESCPPLQAADLYAWCFRRNTDKPDEPTFEWLLPELTNVSLSRYSQYYDEERMKAVLKESEQLFTTGVAAECLKEYRRRFDASGGAEPTSDQGTGHR